MSIQIQDRLFTLETANTALQFKADEYGLLQHLWYGPRTGQDMSFLHDYPDVGFSGQLYEAGQDRTHSPDTRLQEYTPWGNGDYRVSAAVIKDETTDVTDLRYKSHRIFEGRQPLEGLPHAKPGTEPVQTLEVILEDTAGKADVTLSWTVFEQEDVIVRHTRITNRTEKPLRLEKAASLQLDFLAGNPDMIHFHGRHLKERLPERISIPHGITEISSMRGTSSHQHNPSIIVADPDTTEDHGKCTGMLLLYSGSFAIEVEKDQLDQTRVVMGLHPDLFSWELEPGETFVTPEAALSFSSEGLTHLSHNFHNLIRRHIADPDWNRRRPVVLNSWEAAYFNFDGGKILEIAKEAKALDLDMLVLDDGWFGKRDDDKAGLGDWTVNEEKLGMPLQTLIGKIKDIGLDFGIWIEPEMVSEDSSLYRRHPDWAMKIPGRQPVVGRNQLVLDMSRQEVIDHLYDQLSRLFAENPITYVKWDMNRSIANWHSHRLPADRQCELPHRYMLGLYQLLDRLRKSFPHILFEGCSGGGGRYDAGMLFYTPQIWGSDDTDPHERTMIQYGTSFFYPACTLASHVSASPNHQTGRTTSLEARATVAMQGTFGYELDPEKLTEEEKEEIREQVRWYRHLQPLVFEGTQYRLTDPEKDGKAVWMFVSPDKKDVLVQGLIYETIPNRTRRPIRLKGLDPDRTYILSATNFEFTKEEAYTGRALMEGGILLPVTWGSDAPVTLVFHAAGE